MVTRKGDDIGILKRKHCVVLYGVSAEKWVRNCRKTVYGINERKNELMN